MRVKKVRGITQLCNGRVSKKVNNDTDGSLTIEAARNGYYPVQNGGRAPEYKTFRVERAS